MKNYIKVIFPVFILFNFYITYSFSELKPKPVSTISPEEVAKNAFPCPKGAFFRMEKKSWEIVKECVEKKIVDAETLYIQHGRKISYFSNGKVKMEGNFLNGYPEGTLLMNGPSGKRAFEAKFKDGKLHGDILRWHENGNLAEKSEYENGKLVKGKVWDENGKSSGAKQMTGWVATKTLSKIKPDGSSVTVTYSPDGKVVKREVKSARSEEKRTLNKFFPAYQKTVSRIMTKDKIGDDNHVFSLKLTYKPDSKQKTGTTDEVYTILPLSVFDLKDCTFGEAKTGGVESTCLSREKHLEFKFGMCLEDKLDDGFIKKHFPGMKPGLKDTLWEDFIKKNGIKNVSDLGCFNDEKFARCILDSGKKGKGDLTELRVAQLLDKPYIIYLSITSDGEELYSSAQKLLETSMDAIHILSNKSDAQ